MPSDERILSLEETAAMLRVSPATVTNWIRQEYLLPEKRRHGIGFRYADVRSLKGGIERGRVKRLASRANKSTAPGTFVPREYIGHCADADRLDQILSHIKDNDIATEEALFVCAVNLLRRDGFISGKIKAQDTLRSGYPHIRGENIRSEMLLWQRELGDLDQTESCMLLMEKELPAGGDVLGLIYQSLIREGDKSLTGSYYTPGNIVEDIASSHGRAGMSFLDPCCGTGQFLLAFALRTGDPATVCGFDIDPIAVRIARLNLMMRFRGIDFAPSVYRRDVLLDMTGTGRVSGSGTDRFDVIATNPPWGLHYTAGEIGLLRARYPEIRSGESFSYIVRKGIDLCPDGGRLSFILPESMLNVKAHSDIRHFLLENTRIRRIIYLGRVFKKVFTPVIRLDLEKGGFEGGTVIGKGRPFAVHQERFRENKDLIFDVHADPRDKEILDKVYGTEHLTLKRGALWALGIVTGDNQRHLSRVKKGTEYEAIYRGREVERYRLGNAAAFIRFRPQEYQQVAPLERYRAPEKLIYRFICKRLVFAYDDRGSLTLNSANIVIPLIENYPLKAILGLFNSPLYQFIFMKKFASLKVLRGHLEELPLPLWGDAVLAGIESSVEGILSGRSDSRDLDEQVMSLYGLTMKEREHIRNSAA